MNIIQKIFKFFVSAETFENAKKESQAWFFTCDCGIEFNVWEIGGIRYKAKGYPVKQVKCPGCNKTLPRRLHRK